MFSNISSKSLLLYTRFNNYQRVQAILADRANIVNTNLQDETGKTSLHWAVVNLNPFTTYIILNDYAVNGKRNYNIIKPNINIQDNKGWTVLHYLAKTINNLKFTHLDRSFCHSDNYIILQILLNYNIDVNIQDYKGNTALHYAICNKNLFFYKRVINS